ncbi:hypothetical protein [Paenibacillus sp.]|uniref:hypothetical protein n=1 Tax=Paenibacillus sp. TaxID=58172 RepID=UPI002D5E20E2|nr:hypothetical protein [Paenibacillus sp.]HZG55051.1 hypothetical protein [Paenibacillus sp.]
MARTFKAEGRRIAKGVRLAFVVVAMLLYGYAFPELDRKYLTAMLAAGWISAELAAWWWVRRRRVSRSARSPAGGRGRETRGRGI